MSSKSKKSSNRKKREHLPIIGHTPKYDPSLTNKDRMGIRAKIRKINKEEGRTVFDVNTLERVS